MPRPAFDDDLSDHLRMDRTEMRVLAQRCEDVGEGLVVSSAADLNVPLLSPIRCGLSSSFFQVTVVPAVTVKVAGAKAKLSILTVAGTECLLDSTSCCAAP